MSQQEDVEAVKAAADKHRRVEQPATLNNGSEDLELQDFIVTTQGGGSLTVRATSAQEAYDIAYKRGIPLDPTQEGSPSAGKQLPPRLSGVGLHGFSSLSEEHLDLCWCGWPEDKNCHLRRPVAPAYEQVEGDVVTHTSSTAPLPPNLLEDVGIGYNAVEPPHYNGKLYVEVGPCDTYGNLTGHSRTTMERDGKLYVQVDCIDVFREIQDPRLATALKYIWRVAFGGKAEPWDTRDQHERDARDIESARWYLADYVAKLPKPLADSPAEAYDDLVYGEGRVIARHKRTDG